MNPSLYSVTVEGQALVGTVAQTVLQVAGGSRGLSVVEWSISFDGVTSTNVPVLVQIMRSVGAGTSTAFTPRELNPSGLASEGTARTAFTGEPTPGEVLQNFYVTPNAGLLFVQLPYEREIICNSTEQLAIRATAPDAVNVNANLVFAE